jgi:hypothetical protein
LTSIGDVATLLWKFTPPSCVFLNRSDLKDGGTKFLQIIGIYLPIDTASGPRTLLFFIPAVTASNTEFFDHQQSNYSLSKRLPFQGIGVSV